MTKFINSARLWQQVAQIAAITRPDIPWTRRAFTPLFTEARQWLCQQMQQAGLTVNTDAGGNLIGRRPGLCKDLLPIIIGSHCDTVTEGGRYDGIIGVMAGIEIARTLEENNISLQHPLEIIDFLSEEPSDYGISCVGSRALSGNLTAEMLAATNPEGETLAQAMLRIGANPQQLTMPLRSSGSTAAYIELHIEQGPVLESQQLPIGVVSHIVGIRRVSIAIEGQADHSGTTPMNIRRDALAGAANIIEQSYQLALNQSGSLNYVVATIGRINVSPNAANAVPGRAELTLEVRSDNQQVLDSFPEQLMRQCQPRLQQYRLQSVLSPLSQARPTACSEMVMRAIESAANRLDLACIRLPSGAGHDAVYMAQTGPMGMVFIPCLQGRSHCPQESITEQQLADGANVMAQTVLNLDKQLSSVKQDSCLYHY